MIGFDKVLVSHPEWPRFSEEYWGKRPFLFRDVLPRPLFEEGQLLLAYRRARERQVDAEREKVTLVRGAVSVDSNVIAYLERHDGTWENGYTRAEDVIRLFPGSGDPTCADYVARVRRETSCAGVAAHLRYNLLGYNPSLVEPAEELVTPVFERIGFPGSWTLDSYLGQYQSTAFGVHQDLTEDQLYVSPVGTKQILLWAPHDWESCAHHRDFKFNSAGHPSKPIVFSVSPRDVAYWPRDYYHIGSSPETALSVQFNLRPRRLAADARNLGLRRITSLTPTAIAAEVTATHAAIKDWAAGLAATVQEVVLTQASVHFITNEFDKHEANFALRLPKGKEGATRFQAHAVRKPVWLVTEQNLLVACNGASMKVSGPLPVLDALLREISLGTEFSVPELLDRCGSSELRHDPMRTKGIEEFVRALWNIGALVGVA